MLTATHFYECWDERHPLTRREDRRLREETMKYVNDQGLFSGSEWPVAYSMPYLSYYRNGGAGGGDHGILSQFPVPLFNLVFKDCALMYGQFFPEANAETLRDMAAGSHLQATYFGIHEYYKEGHMRTRESLRQNVPLYQDWLRQVGLEELTSHRFVDELNGPYVTQFSDGSEALANLTQETREVEGMKLQPESTLFRFADGRTLWAKPLNGWDLD